MSATRSNRPGDSQPMPSASDAPVAHDMAYNDLILHPYGTYVEDIDELYDSLLDGAILLNELRNPDGATKDHLAKTGEDIQARLKLGIERYGQPLQPFNGRDMLQDAYEEILDAIVYLRAALYEIDHELQTHVVPSEPAPTPNIRANTDLSTMKKMVTADDDKPIKRAEP